LLDKPGGIVESRLNPLYENSFLLISPIDESDLCFYLFN